MVMFQGNPDVYGMTRDNMEKVPPFIAKEQQSKLFLLAVSGSCGIWYDSGWRSGNGVRRVNGSGVIMAYGMDSLDIVQGNEEKNDSGRNQIAPSVS